MTQLYFTLFFLTFILASDQLAVYIDENKITYYDSDHFLLEGTDIPTTEKENQYDRLPAAYKELVRTPVWDLSKNSAGMSVRFKTNSSNIHVKWTLLNDLSMNHMADTGIKGLDLYVSNDGKWQYLNTARPTGKESHSHLMTSMPEEWREYRIYLPLYDGLIDLQIGIDESSKIQKALSQSRKPIVFYGTSITQGGCASRPGMAHTNIISRKLDVECINFGFSGNGRMETPIGELISEIDASFFVIECLPNMKPEQVTERTIPLVNILRKQHPTTPIVLVENFIYEQSFLNSEMNKGIADLNRALRTEYEELIKSGEQNIRYVESDGATGVDHEGTVDGVHFTDLGFARYADFLIEKFEGFGLEIREE